MGRNLPHSVPFRRVDSFMKLSSSGRPSALFSNSFHPPLTSCRSGDVYSACVQRSASAKVVVYTNQHKSMFRTAKRRRRTLVSPTTGKKKIPRHSWAIRAALVEPSLGNALMTFCRPSIYAWSARSSVCATRLRGQTGSPCSDRVLSRLRRCSMVAQMISNRTLVASQRRVTKLAMGLR